MRINLSLDLELREDLSRVLNKNSLTKDKVVSLAYKVTNLITNTRSKVQETNTYDKIINNYIYGNRWYKAFDEKL